MTIMKGTLNTTEARGMTREGMPLRRHRLLRLTGHAGRDQDTGEDLHQNLTDICRLRLLRHRQAGPDGKTAKGEISP